MGYTGLIWVGSKLGFRVPRWLPFKSSFFCFSTTFVTVRTPLACNPSAAGHSSNHLNSPARPFLSLPLCCCVEPGKGSEWGQQLPLPSSLPIIPSTQLLSLSIAGLMRVLGFWGPVSGGARRDEKGGWLGLSRNFPLSFLFVFFFT